MSQQNQKFCECTGMIVIEMPGDRMARYAFYEQGHHEFKVTSQLIQPELDMPVTYVKFGPGQTLLVNKGTTYEEAVQQLQAYKPPVVENPAEAA